MSDIQPLDATAYKVLADVLGGNGKVVAYRPYFAHAFGGACNALLLSQFWFWTNTDTVKAREGGWFWKTQKEITLETGLTRTETETARRKLGEIGVLEEDLCGVPATLHYRVNKDVLFEILWRFILANRAQFAENLQSAGYEQNPQTSGADSGKVVRGKRADKIGQKRQTITDKTLDSKTKNTSEQEAASPPAPAARPVFSSSFQEQEKAEEKEPVIVNLPEKPTKDGLRAEVRRCGLYAVQVKVWDCYAEATGSGAPVLGLRAIEWLERKHWLTNWGWQI